MTEPTILEVMDDPALFKSWFSLPSWDPWRATLKALFGLPMNDRERRLFRKITGRRKVPTKPAEEAWLRGGPRGGNSILRTLVAL